MKKKKILIACVVIAVIVIVVIALISTAPNRSSLTYEAVVQETVTQSDGEIRLIVKRTTEIYGDPVNSLGISDETQLVDTDGKEITIDDFESGDAVRVRLKDAFNEEVPFYYPTVYEIVRIATDK